MISRSGSILFKPKNIGPITIMNRFMRSATWDGRTDGAGMPLDEHFEMLVYLARGMVGLICPGDMEVNLQNIGPRTYAISGPEYIETWKGVIDSIHTRGNKIMFQLNHKGPECPTKLFEDQIELNDTQIQDYIDLYVKAALCSLDADVDGIQFHGSHGFFLSSWLSPARNLRKDKWGGSTENRARILKEIITEVKKKAKKPFFVSLKLNGSDIDPRGLTPDLSADLVHELKGYVDMFEISCNITQPYYQIASEFNINAITRGVPKDKHQDAIANAQKLLHGVHFKQEFNRPFAEIIRKKNPDAILALVGGNREFDKMEKLVKSGLVDFVSMSRPFLKDPFIVKEMYEGKVSKSDCLNCGACLINSDYGVYCRMNKQAIW